MTGRAPAHRLLALLLTAVAAPAAEPVIQESERSFTIRSPRLEATVADGVIVGLRSLAGEVHADPATAELDQPRGLGHLSGDPQAVERLHMPWGNAAMNQALPAGGRYPTQHHPHPGSAYRAERVPGGIKATWTGLTNGQQQFPAEALTVELTVDPASGEIHFRATGGSPDGGVYGVQVPLANLHPDHRFYVPSFGGLYYDQAMRPALITLGGNPFWEAPVFAAEGRRDTLGVWVENAAMPQDFFFLNWTGKSFSAAIEHLNPMPFEERREVQSVTWHLDVFPGGWVEAMTPYKRFYERTFAADLARRDAVGWADRIRVIIDECGHTDEEYQRLGELFPPDTLLFHDWNARAPQFDHDLPDWTPREGYVDKVKRLHQRGFRAMAYVNSYCVNYNSPVYQRDQLDRVALLRTIRGIYRYTQRAARDQLKDGQLLYLDPLSAGWRKYHVDQMIWWLETTGTDANYEDTAGACGDFGNGVVDGLAGQQGTIAEFRELLQRNPTVPMSAEYGPAPVAFAVKWPLRYQQVWGNDATRAWWITHMRPVETWLFGHRPWIPTIRAGSGFARHVVLGCADALGGVAQIATTGGRLEAARGDLVQMLQRARLFASKQLTPVFPPERQPADLACWYQDQDGRRYAYYAGEQCQKLVGPDGKSLYERVFGRNQVGTELSLPGWPASQDGKLVGLDPAGRYALVPEMGEAPAVRLAGIPEGVRLRRYYTDDRFQVITLTPAGEAAPKSGSIRLLTDQRFDAVVLNDAVVEPLEQQPANGYATPFPASFVLISGEVEQPAPATWLGSDQEATGRLIGLDDGLDRGGVYTIKHRRPFPVPGEPKPPLFRYLNGGGDAEPTMDYLFRVPSADCAVVVYLRNTQKKYGNAEIARIYLNGRPVHERDLGPVRNPDWQEGMDPALKSLWDTDLHAWRVPLGHLAGRPVLFTIATDDKADNNADELWWSRPKLVADPDQKPRYERLIEDQWVPDGQ